MNKQRRPMSDISEDIKKNNQKKPTQNQIDELFTVLEKEGLTDSENSERNEKKEDQAARPYKPEPQL